MRELIRFATFGVVHSNSALRSCESSSDDLMLFVRAGALRSSRAFKLQTPHLFTIKSHDGCVRISVKHRVKAESIRNILFHKTLNIKHLINTLII